jgi:hypothetical protein
MSTPEDGAGGLPDAAPFPDGFGFYDRPPPVLPDPTAAPPALGPPAISPPSVPPAPPEPPEPRPQPRRGGPPQRHLQPETSPRARSSRYTAPIWTVVGVAIGLFGVVIPLLSNLWDNRVEMQVEEGIDGFDDIGGSTEPLATAELYSEESYTFRIELTDRVMEGELNLTEAFDHPDCASAAETEEAERALAACGSRIEAAYTGADEGLRVSQQVLMFEDEASAQTFAGLIEDEFAADVLAFEDPGDIEGSGYAASRSGVQGKYVVVTMMVSESGDDEAITTAEEHGHARHAESLSYLIWR